MLKAHDVSYAIGEAWLLRDIHLEARPGELLSIVGPNGAGKSTLLRVLSGELKPATGDVTVDGQPLSEMSPREIALKRAVLPQQTILQFAFAAREVVLMGRNPHLNGGWPGRDDFLIAEDSMTATDTTEHSLRIYPSLSGGEQARVSFARILAQKAPILLLDEPTSSLDIHHQEMVMRLAKSLAERGACVLVIIHDLNLAAAYSDRIALMQRGRIAACGTTCDVIRDDLLSDVFECRLRVIPDGHGAPVVIPARP